MYAQKDIKESICKTSGSKSFGKNKPSVRNNEKHFLPCWCQAHLFTHRFYGQMISLQIKIYKYKDFILCENWSCEKWSGYGWKNGNIYCKSQHTAQYCRAWVGFKRIYLIQKGFTILVQLVWYGTVLVQWLTLDSPLVGTASLHHSAQPANQHKCAAGILLNPELLAIISVQEG